MPLHDYLRLLRRNWFVVALLTLLGLLGGLVFAASQKPVFQASTAVVVATGQSQDVNDLNASTTFAQQAVKTYASVLTSPLVLNPVIRRLRLDVDAATLAREITTSTPLETTVLQISVSDESSVRSAQVANEVANSLAQVVQQLTPSTARSSDVTVTQIQPALAPSAPIRPKILTDAVLGLLIGAVLGLGASVLREALGVRVREAEDVRSLTDRPIIGRILFDRGIRSQPITFRNDATSPEAEAYRFLRTALHYIDFERGPQQFVITSSVEAEGKSACAANLAVAIGDTGTRVLVIDADLRRPTLTGYFGFEDNTPGLTDVLVGDASIDEAIRQIGTSSTFLMSAGRIPPNPNELLQSGSMTRLLANLEARYDTVLLDGPPLLAVSDSAILARITSGALVVAAVGRVKRPQLRAALLNLESVGALVLGVALTMVPSTNEDRYIYRTPPSPGSARQRAVRRRTPGQTIHEPRST